MAQDTLTKLQEDLTHRRTSLTVALGILGQPIPVTEREWLRFNLNENLRARGFQAPLENLNEGREEWYATEEK